jgi:hypothetical protein
LASKTESLLRVSAISETNIDDPPIYWLGASGFTAKSGEILDTSP